MSNRPKRVIIQEQKERITELLIQGKTEKEIAGSLNLTRRTVVHRIEQMKQESSSVNITEYIAKVLYHNADKFAHLFQTHTPGLGCV